jgi:cell division protein FtsQ
MLWQLWLILDKPITTLVVKGEMTIAEREKIQLALGAVDVAGILSTDLREFELVLGSMGWAKGVDIRRKWPNKMVVNIRKENPVAKWGLSEYLAGDGSVLLLPDGHPNLPRLRSSLSSPRQSMQVYRLLQQFASRQSLRIMELSESAEGEWIVGFSNGLALHLGSREINARMNRFLRAYGSTLQEKAAMIDYIDARYPSGIAVKFVEQAKGSLADGKDSTAFELAANVTSPPLSGI